MSQLQLRQSGKMIVKMNLFRIWQNMEALDEDVAAETEDILS